MKKGNKEGFSLIRIYQKDVWEDKNEWEIKLKSAIDSIYTNSVKIICISSSDKKMNMLYEKYNSNF